MTDSDDLARTPLHALHEALAARMVPFAGYAMPVQYPGGIIKEHQHTRAKAGLFDVSHMGQIRLSGPHAAAALETVLPIDVADLEPGKQRYGLLTNDQGGIRDDLMVTNAGDHLFVVVNAACKQADIAYLRKQLAGRCEIEELQQHALLALQGPAAAGVMAQLAPETTQMVFMTARSITLDDADCFVTRSGYTGEDGFEISVPNAHAEALARKLLAYEEVAPIGLGARDSLRLEAGLCLYGHDIDTQTTPVEAGLSWSISKARRDNGARAGGFPGAERILRELNEGPQRRRVGLLPHGKAPVREGAELIDENDEGIGHVTSGGFGPSVGGPIAMGYATTGYAQTGAHIQALVRDKPRPVLVTTLPFVRQRYYRG
ncbi:MAG: glycine cleavage system aminomethyltransferase GcvT [Gammaproteobacteria bacterium]